MSSTRKTILGLTAALAISATLAGCTLNKTIDVSTAIWCETNTPTRPTVEQYATFSDQQKIDMADHNEFGAKHCGWKPGNARN